MRNQNAKLARPAMVGGRRHEVGGLTKSGVVDHSVNQAGWGAGAGAGARPELTSQVLPRPSPRCQSLVRMWCSRHYQPLSQQQNPLQWVFWRNKKSKTINLLFSWNLISTNWIIVESCQPPSLVLPSSFIEKINPWNKTWPNPVAHYICSVRPVTTLYSEC